MNDPETLFSPIKNKRTFEEVSSKIKELIFDGLLKPGDKLPSESQLAQQFQVGRQTIREALRLLELSGFISIQTGAGGGPFIKNTIFNRIGDLFLNAFRMRNISLEELTVARLEIEKVVLNYVIDQAEESDIMALKKNVLEARKKIEKNVLATEENFQFHKLLAEASKNDVFVIVMESIMAVHADLMSGIRVDLEVSRRGVTYHENILKAIIEKDRSKAPHLLKDHIMEVRDQLESLVKKEN